MRIAIIGCGQIGEALARGMLSANFAADQLSVSARTESRVAELTRSLRIRGTTDNRAAVHGATVVILSLKPKAVVQVLREIASELERDALIISVAAGISTGEIEANAENHPVIRAMPNLPAIIHQGITCLARGRLATEEHLNLARALFSSVGRTVTVEEEQMDAVTGLSGSGPAFVFMVIESLAEGGVNVGLPRAVALELAAQTVVGSGKMVLETGKHPAQLKDEVTTPAGCTVEGIMQLEDGGLRVAIIKAVARAAKRAGQLATE